MSLPLAGLRVLTLGDGLVVGIAGQVLADYGADVVQVEPPGGSVLRSQPAWPFWGRGRRTIELDLDADDEQPVARGLALRSDVVLQALRPGVAERYRLGYEDLAADNPALVYASVSAFGRHGPLADLPGYEGIVMAKLGVLSAVADLTEREGPSFPSAPFSTYPAAQLALQGILAALYEREGSGRGQHVETTLAQGLTVHDTFNWFARVVADRFRGGFTQVPLTVRGVPSGGMSFRLLIALTRDGRWLQFSQTVDRLFRAMMRLFELDWMFDTPEWSSAPDFDDVDRRVAFWERLLGVVRTRTADEWHEQFALHPDVWGERFSRGNEALDHPQVRFNGMVMELEDPVVGPVLQPTPVALMDGVALPTRGAPRRGEHDKALRAEAAEARDDTFPDLSGLEPAADAPLAGVTILELGTYYAAPFGATLLADYGARVIKLEQLDGDPHRNMLPFPEVAGIKVLQGKESVAVDLATPEGLAITLDLVRGADIVLQSFRAGVAERLGVDAPSLHAVNPDVLYVSAPGYGTAGPYGHRPAFAPTIGAAAGLAWRNAGALVPSDADMSLEDEKRSAMRLALAVMGVGNSDGFAAVTVATAMLVALLGRRRGAGAPHVLTTMLSSSIHALSEDMVRYDGRAPLTAADDGLHGLGPLYRLYRASEGWVFLAAPTDLAWDRLAGVLVEAAPGAPLTSDRYASGTARAEHADELAGALAAVFAARPAAEWERVLRRAGVACVEVAGGPVDANLLPEGSLGRQCGFVTTTTHPMLDEVPRLAPLVAFSRSATSARGAGMLGTETDAVLAELGYAKEHIATLRAKGVVGGG